MDNHPADRRHEAVEVDRIPDRRDPRLAYIADQGRLWAVRSVSGGAEASSTRSA